MPTRSRHLARRVAWALACLSVTALVVGLIVVVAYVANTVETIRATQQNSRSTLFAIEDCTQPTGDCFRKSQRRTAEVVADIGTVSAFAAACADRPGPQTAAEVQACVLDRLDEEQERRAAK